MVPAVLGADGGDSCSLKIEFKTGTYKKLVSLSKLFWNIYLDCQMKMKCQR